MSDIETTTAAGGEAPEGAGRKAKAKAKAALGQAGQAIRNEAHSFTDMAQDRARTEAQKQTEAATRTLGDFANAVRKAADELGATDQGPAARLVRQAADGLEGVSRNLAGKSPEQLLDDVRAFGRKNPAAFIGGAVPVGVALGRFVRASETGPARSRAPLEDMDLVEESAFEGEAEYAGAQPGEVATAAGDDLAAPSSIEDSADASQVRDS
jgi:hypothetical protein